jgi:hypothetical protein
MLSLVEGKNEEDYDNIKYGDLLKLLHEKTAFFDILPETKPVDTIEVNGRKYKFVHEIEKLTAGQFIDINHFGNDIMEMHNAAGCFMRPIVGKKVLPYNAVEHSLIAEDMLDARFIDVHGCLVFFYHLLIEFSNNILCSLELSEQSKKNLMNFLKDGAGIAQLN